MNATIAHNNSISIPGHSPALLARDVTHKTTEPVGSFHPLDRETESKLTQHLSSEATENHFGFRFWGINE